MREIIKNFISIVADTFFIEEPIYEFGAYQVKGQEKYADLRPFFKNKQYIGADIRKGPGVDIILDLHNIELPSDSVGTIICMDTLEHVEFPRKALKEIYRILKPTGMAVISSVMDFPIHDHPFDYWRFTPEGFKSLLKQFPLSFVGYTGRENFPHTIVGIGFKSSNINLDDFQKKYREWQKSSENTIAIGNIQIKNLYKDHWMGRSASFQFTPNNRNVTINLEIFLPDYINDNVKLYFLNENMNQIHEKIIKKGIRKYMLDITAIPDTLCTIKIFSNSTFIPNKLDQSSIDSRELSVIINNITIQAPK